MKEIHTPISKEMIKGLEPGDMIMISGTILTGRDAVLPKVVQAISEETLDELGICLDGQVMFHTAVSQAGVGPTSSNKLEIEGTMEELSKAGVRIHLGKGRLKPETIQMLAENDSVYAVIPPVTALLESKTISRKVLAFDELGMEALHILEVDGYPAIIAASGGKSIYE